MRIACLVLLVGLTEAVAGCGQKGPLVLPDAQRPHKKISPPKPPPSAPADPTTTGETRPLPAAPR